MFLIGILINSKYEYKPIKNYIQCTGKDKLYILSFIATNNRFPLIAELFRNKILQKTSLLINPV